MRKIAVCAHRGASEGGPAGHAGVVPARGGGRFDYVEFDVRRLADGALVAFHDPAVQRAWPCRASPSTASGKRRAMPYPWWKKS